MRVTLCLIKKSHFFSSWVFINKEPFTPWAPYQICFHVKDYDHIAAKRFGKKILIKLTPNSSSFFLAVQKDLAHMLFKFISRILHNIGNIVYNL